MLHSFYLLMIQSFSAEIIIIIGNFSLFISSLTKSLFTFELKGSTQCCFWFRDSRRI